MILKMDVEGAEWGFLHETNMLGLFKQMTFEFHNIPFLNKDKILYDFKKINDTHQAVWVHANNYGLLVKDKNYSVPNLLEVTFVRRDDYDFEDVEYSSPTGIDYPNNKLYKDIPLEGWGSINAIK